MNVPPHEVRAIFEGFELVNAVPVLSALAESFRTEQAPGRIDTETP